MAAVDGAAQFISPPFDDGRLRRIAAMVLDVQSASASHAFSVKALGKSRLRSL
jgi:hypothetical protein